MDTTDSNDAVTTEIDAIKGDIQKLRDDLGVLLSDIGSYGKGKLGGTRGKLSSAMESVRGKAYERMQETTGEMRDRGRRVMHAPREAVQDRPMTYVVAAFVAGMIFAALFEWKRTS
jgi:ElaB/YqjD/DUF883 family membrane-anchored ribosome-binding protein